MCLPALNSALWQLHSGGAEMCSGMLNAADGLNLKFSFLNVPRQVCEFRQETYPGHGRYCLENVFTFSTGPFSFPLLLYDS